MAASHSHSHGASAESVRDAVSEVEVAGTAEFKPTCQCGCSDTRSLVGGNAARLGSVVPGAVMAGLLEMDLVAPEIRIPLRTFDIHFEIDPIPI